ncbi:14025_t:CDS:2, partial [Funneliformis geosporum]
KVLPPSLFEEIVSFHMSKTEPKQNKLVPRYKKIHVDSMIIKPRHVAVLINWIERKDPNTRIPKDQYKVNLIYRKSRDGSDISTIRSQCSGQGACILIIKTTENETIIGGYNPNGDGGDLKNFKISRVQSSGNAMYESRSQNIALNFGNSDLVINNNAGSCNQGYYESTILDSNNFTIEEMEIFKIN